MSVVVLWSKYQETSADSFLNGVAASMEMRFNKTNALLLKRVHQLCIL
jgi:hypothetical protein